MTYYRSEVSIDGDVTRALRDTIAKVARSQAPVIAQAEKVEQFPERFYPTMDWAEHRHAWPHSAQSHFVNAGGIQWHVQIMGQGPVLLLLHGTGSGSFSWRGLMPLLSSQFQVIAPDLPGHAFTSRGPEGSLSLQGMSEGLRALLLQLNVTPSVIGGHSAGAAIAANMLLQQRTLSKTQLIGFNPAWLPLPGLPSLIFRPAAKLAAINPISAWATAKR